MSIEKTVLHYSTVKFAVDSLIEAVESRESLLGNSFFILEKTVENIDSKSKHYLNHDFESGVVKYGRVFEEAWHSKKSKLANYFLSQEKLKISYNYFLLRTGQS